MDFRSQTASFRYLHHFIYCGKAARCVCHSLDIDVSISLFCTDVPQSALETVVPKTQDAHVRVVRGRLRGQVSGYYSVSPPSPPLSSPFLCWGLHAGSCESSRLINLVPRVPLFPAPKRAEKEGPWERGYRVFRLLFHLRDVLVGSLTVVNKKNGENDGAVV